MGTRQEQEQEEEKIVRIFFQKVRIYNEGKCKGECTHLDNLPKIRDHWDRMYKWIMVLTAFIDKMMHKPSKEMRKKQKNKVCDLCSSWDKRKRRSGESSIHD